MGIVFKNNAKTTLASSLSNSATSATVTDGSVFPSLSAGEFFLLTFDDGTNNEICKCTARSGNTLTIVRAQESTTARAFSSGDAAEGRVTAGVLETIQENIAAKSANQTVYNTTTASSATDYDIGIDPSVEANAMVFLNGVMQHHDTFSFSGSTLTFDAAPPNGMALEVIVDNLINLQSSNLTVDTFTATSGQTDFVLSDTPAAETNLIVFVDGVFQDQDSYTISNNTLTITDGVVLNRGVTVYVINPVNIGTPSDGTVTSAKLSGNITMPGTLTVGSNDVAFDSPTFVVDNANSRVGLGTASPSVPVDIVGDVKMSANLTVDTSTLAVDSTNNRVGIGTASPTSDLTVNGTTGLTITGMAGVTNPAIYIPQGGILGDNAGTFEIRNGGGGSSELRLSSRSFHTFYTGGGGDLGTGTEKLRIDSSGNVGIGTTNPVGKLSISDSGATGVEFSPDDSNARVQQLYYDRVDNAYRTSLFDAGDYQFRISGTERVRIDSSGKVGIGTDSPSRELDIQAASGWAELALRGASGSAGSLEYYNASTKLAEIYADTSTNIIFRNSTGGTTERMRIQSNGEVEISGIGNTSGARLNIGSDANNAFVRSYDTAAGIVIGTTNAHPVKFMSNSSERMRIDSSGNLLVGTTDATPYDNTSGNGILLGDGLISSAQSGGNAAIFNRMTSDGSIVNFRKDGSTVGVIASKASTSGSVMIIGSGDTGIAFENLVLRPRETDNGTSDGAIDLGTSSDRFKDLYLTSKVNLGDTYRGLTYRSANNDVLLEAAAGLFYRQDIGNTNHSWFTGNSERMRIASTGRVSIGTTSTNAGLTVANADIRCTGAAVLNDANSISMSQESGGGFLTARGPSTSTRGSISLNVSLSTGGSGIVGLKVENTGNVTIAGALSKGSGSFKIDHPLKSKKDTHHLVHSFVEAPQADNIYRGVVTLVDGSATINLDTEAGMTEGTFVLLNTNTSCFTSNESDWDAVKGSVSGNILTISCQNTSSTATVSWLVIGERHDQHMLDTDWTDENGKVIVEPLKGETE